MRLAERFKLPLVTLVDTSGAFPGKDAEERGQAEAIARSIETCLDLETPFVSIVIGEGGSGGAIALAAANTILMLEHAIYSVISPESCSSILWRSWDFKEQAAEVLKLTAKDMLAQKLIDGVIREPLGGAHVDVKWMAGEIKKAILEKTQELSKFSPDERTQQRIDKFSAMGVVKE